MTVLLGTYGKLATPFYLYTHRSNTYLSLEDINFIYFNQQLNTKIKLIKKLLDCNSSDFIKEKSTGNILLLTQKIVRIARLFNCYSLAELCKLSLDEIIGKVALPLLNTINCDQWIPFTNKITVVERDLQFEALHGDEWPFIAPPVASAQNDLFPPIIFPLNENNKSIYKWLSFNLFENCHSREMLDNLLTTAKTSKQQQAIVETRQRKTAFSLSRAQRNTSKQKTPRKRQHNLIRNKSKLPPSPPQTNKRSHEDQLEFTNSKRLKTTIVTGSTELNSFDNLTLLATQATQLRGLLLSPEVSPSPPPNHQHRLPSLQTLLSDLKNHPFP